MKPAVVHKVNNLAILGRITVDASCHEQSHCRRGYAGSPKDLLEDLQRVGLELQQSTNDDIVRASELIAESRRLDLGQGWGRAGASRWATHSVSMLLNALNFLLLVAIKLGTFLR